MTTATTATPAPASAPVNTKAAERRPLAFESLDAIRAEVNRLAQLGEEGIISTGNWSAGQNLWHLERFMECSLDGFDKKGPAPLRWWLSALFRKKALNSTEPFPSGVRLPKQASFLLPPDSVPLHEGAAKLLACLDRVDAGDRFTAQSPVLGNLSHEEWSLLHRKHAAMHLSFLHDA